MLAADLRPGARVLEVGCGTGLLTSELVRRQAAVVAMDLSEHLLEVARQRPDNTDALLLRGNAYELSFRSNTFDGIVGSSVLHHLDVPQALREFHRVLRPGGWLRFTEPNMLNPQIALQKNIPVLKRMLGDSPDETAFVRWALRRQLERFGFHEISIIPFDFLHPATPTPLIPVIDYVGRLAEKALATSEIAGSLYIRAVKRT